MTVPVTTLPLRHLLSSLCCRESMTTWWLKSSSCPGTGLLRSTTTVACVLGVSTRLHRLKSGHVSTQNLIPHPNPTPHSLCPTPPLIEVARCTLIPMLYSSFFLCVFFLCWNGTEDSISTYLKAGHENSIFPWVICAEVACGPQNGPSIWVAEALWCPTVGSPNLCLLMLTAVFTTQCCDSEGTHLTSLCS